MDVRRLVVLSSVLMLVGCAPTGVGPTYDRSAVGAVQQTVYGLVVSMQPVQVAKSAVPAIGVGGATGATAGALIAGADNRVLGAVIGGAAGALGGKAIGGRATKQMVQYQIRLDNGSVLSMIQPEGRAQVGQRVMVVMPSGNSTGSITPCV